MISVIYRWVVCHDETWNGHCPSAGKRWVAQIRRLPSGLVEMPDVRCPDCLCTPKREAPWRQFMYAEWMTFAA